MVLGGGKFVVGGPIGKFFPILEIFPPVGNEIYVRGFPLGVETIGEFEIDGEF